MKLLGRTIDGKRLVDEVRTRLSARGISEDAPDAPLEDEAPVEPFAFLVQALEENVDPAQPPAARGSSRPVRGLIRWATRSVLEELFGRQRAFNVHVRDLAAQLSAEVLSLRARVSELEALATRGASLVSRTGPARAKKTSARKSPRR